MAGENKKTAPVQTGENVSVEETETEIVIRLSKSHRGAFNGKTTRVASTLGNYKVGKSGITIGLNAWIKPVQKEEPSA